MSIPWWQQTASSRQQLQYPLPRQQLWTCWNFSTGNLVGLMTKFFNRFPNIRCLKYSAGFSFHFFDLTEKRPNLNFWPNWAKFLPNWANFLPNSENRFFRKSNKNLQLKCCFLKVSRNFLLHVNQILFVIPFKRLKAVFSFHFFDLTEKLSNRILT